MERLNQLRAHPWHGVEPGKDTPEWVTAYIEIVPNDGMKYELDKDTGLLRLDRPQRFSSQCPTLYGFIPRSYCGVKVAERAMQRTGLEELKGDGDPMDICVLSERAIPHGDFLVRCRPIGGLRMVDHGEADDKIIAVLEADAVYGRIEELAQLPNALVDRLRHYFLSYKQLPGEEQRAVSIEEVYGRVEAHGVIRRSLQDYRVEVLGEKEPARKEPARPAPTERTAAKKTRPSARSAARRGGR
jgi:inorganic pyrophosphatase